MSEEREAVTVQVHLDIKEARALSRLMKLANPFDTWAIRRGKSALSAAIDLAMGKAVKCSYCTEIVMLRMNGKMKPHMYAEDPRDVFERETDIYPKRWCQGGNEYPKE